MSGIKFRGKIHWQNTTEWQKHRNKMYIYIKNGPLHV